MLRRFIVAAALVSSASAAIAAPTYIHAGRLIAVPGKAALGPSTIIVDTGRIAEVRDGRAIKLEGNPELGIDPNEVAPPASTDGAALAREGMYETGKSSE